jgi:hypothetical protein
MSHSKDDF